MVHLLYTRDGKNGERDTISFHFLPTSQNSKDGLSLTTNSVKNISDSDDFPVIGWLDGNWICTVCSNDLDLATLKQVAAR